MKAMSTPHFDFDSPQRQSTIAILLVILKTLKVLFRQIALPFFVFVVMGKKGSDYGTYFVVFICSISFISMVYSIINHFRSFYYIANNELVVHSGILGKKKLSIPIERIQTINFEENLIHKLFHVKRLKIDGDKLNDIFFITDESFYSCFHIQEMDIEYPFSVGANKGVCKVCIYFGSLTKKQEDHKKAELTCVISRVNFENIVNADAKGKVISKIDEALHELFGEKYQLMLSEREK